MHYKDITSKFYFAAYMGFNFAKFWYTEDDHLKTQEVKPNLTHMVSLFNSQ